MTAYNLLLSFLSEKGRGSWVDLKHAWAWILGGESDPAAKAWIVAQELSALGHIELVWGDEIEWCTAPPVLTMIPRSGGRALLTGARTRALYDPSSGAGSPTGAVVDAMHTLNLYLDEWPQNRSPSTLMVCCETHLDADRLAKALDIYYTYSVAHQLSALLPALATYDRFRIPGELPRGFDAERFNEDSLYWDSVTDTSAHGLYRCRTFEKHVHAVNGPTGWFRVPRELGQYETLRWAGRSVLSYSRERMQLIVRSGARLPAVHARAATLCSGRLPNYAKGNLYYENVEELIARRIADSLSQDLKPSDE